MAFDNHDPGFGIYVHWPFCASKCPYCDFNSHVRHRPVDQARYGAALAQELAHMAAIQPNRVVTSVFFGGGTPSLMEPQTVATVLDAIAGLWGVADDAEITLEANPSSADAGRFAGYRAAGVNRVSLGVQSLDDQQLKFLGRLHSADEARAAINLARKTFDRMSFDLIYARPQQTETDWRAELNEAIDLAADHLSLYQLTIEQGTPFFGLHQKGAFAIPEPDQAADLYEVTQEVTDRHGMPAYEISNHARPGDESRHNLTYWRFGTWAGVGPGAHGRLDDNQGRHAISTLSHPEGWLEAVEKYGHGIGERELLDPEATADEMLLMGLRLREGIDLDRYAAFAGRPLAAKRINDLVDHGMVERFADNRLRTTPEGALVLDAVIADLAA